MEKKILNTIRDHFLNPRNQGEIADAHLVLEMGSIADGNAVKLMIKFDGSSRICDVKFQTFGDGESIAAFSILTEILIGKTAEEAAHITEDDIRDRISASEKQSLLKTERAVSLLRMADPKTSPGTQPGMSAGGSE